MTLAPLPKAAADPLGYDAGVDRHLVHRASIAEVFITDGRRLNEHTFEIAGQLPRGHTMIETGTYDVNLMMELVRQAGVYAAHRFFGVPTDTAFIFRDMDAHLAPESLTVSAENLNFLVQMSAVPERTKRGEIRCLTFYDDVRLGGNSVLWGALRKRGRLQALGSTASQNMRRRAISPAEVGRRNPRNVVITTPRAGGTEGAWGAWLIVDESHPSAISRNWSPDWGGAPA